MPSICALFAMDYLIPASSAKDLSNPVIEIQPSLAARKKKSNARVMIMNPTLSPGQRHLVLGICGAEPGMLMMLLLVDWFSLLTSKLLCPDNGEQCMSDDEIEWF